MPKSRVPLSKTRKRTKRSAMYRRLSAQRKCIGGSPESQELVDPLVSPIVDSTSSLDLRVLRPSGTYSRQMHCNGLPDNNRSASPMFAADSPQLNVEVSSEHILSLCDVLKGRRVVDLGYVLEQFESIAQHPLQCTLGCMRAVSEFRRGLHSAIHFQCDVCDTKQVLHTECLPNGSKDVNHTFVWGAVMVGIGHSQAEEFFSVMDVPVLSAPAFQEHEKAIEEEIKPPLAVFIKSNEGYDYDDEEKEEDSEEDSQDIDGRQDILVPGFKVGCPTKPVEGMDSYQESHSTVRVYTCDVCPKSFKKRDSLSTHRKIHTGKRPFQCDTCKKCFTTRKYLSNHKKTHSEQEDYQCDICKKFFSTRKCLSVHKQIHSGEKHYQCDRCAKLFVQKVSLLSHMTTHFEERAYQCEICQKSFKTKRALKIHKRRHTGEKVFQCNTCQKSFVTSSALSRHKKTHTEEKPHQCDICLKRFLQRYNLSQHQKTHSGERPFQCHICLKGFSTKQSRSIHIKTHVKDKHTSVIDSQKTSYASGNELSDHVQETDLSGVLHA